MNYIQYEEMGQQWGISFYVSHLFLPIAFVALHLRELEMEMIVICVNLMTLFKHVIDRIYEIYFLKRKKGFTIKVDCLHLGPSYSLSSFV